MVVVEFISADFPCRLVWGCERMMVVEEEVVTRSVEEEVIR